MIKVNIRKSSQRFDTRRMYMRDLNFLGACMVEINASLLTVGVTFFLYQNLST